ncbi:MAG TPA: ISKra4 family transposase [Streptosporangiaceae bacterium]|nr:ISKra4 family transposase [Streptosporangiaceae bacterium]
MALLPACTCLSCPAHGEAAAAALAGPGPEPGGAGGFSGSGRLFGGITSWLAGPDAGGLTHAGLEDELGSRSRELTRRLYQDHLDLRAAREQRRGQVTGLDGVARIRAEAGHTRVLSTVFGPVTVSRIAYRAPGAGNVHPADEELGLPRGRHSAGLGKMAAAAAARGSFEQACAEVSRQTGSVLGKRQCQELARAAAADFADFCARRQPPRAAPGQVLVLSCDGKGVMVRPGHLRPRAAQVARRAAPKQDGRLSRGEVRTRKRMAEIGAVYDITPVPRTPEDILGPRPDGPRPDAPRAERKHLTVSITADAADVVAGMLAEAERRDPGHQRTWIALVDGNKDQIRWIQDSAAARGITITIICDLVHVLEYLWNAAWCFFPEASPDAAPWVHGHAAAILHGRATEVAEAIRAQAAATLTKAKRKTAARTAGYLDAKAPYLDYPQALASGWPVSTGVIEGACRHLVKDRMDITGARWGVPTAEAILQLRALHANGDFDTYWTYHLNREHHRNHPHPQTSYQLAT